MEQLKQFKYIPQKSAILKTEFPTINQVIMIASGKGGVGKSTVAAGLALSLSLEGYSVGLLDADIYGPSIPTLFDLENCERPLQSEHDGKNIIEPIIRYGIKIMSIGLFFDPQQAIIWRGPLLANGLKQMLTETNWGELDYLIIDTPPGTGDVHITLMQDFKINSALVVTTPQQMAMVDVQKVINMLNDKQIGVPILGIIENMSWFTPTAHPNEKYYLFGKNGGHSLSKLFNVPLLVQIPINEDVCTACDAGKLNGLFQDNSIRFAFENLVNNIIS